jgi:hypothetical protein
VVAMEEIYILLPWRRIGDTLQEEEGYYFLETPKKVIIGKWTS